MIAAVRRALQQIGLGPLYDALVALEQAFDNGGGANPMLPPGPVVLTSGNKQTSHPTIHAALAAAITGDTISLYPGTYPADETLSSTVDNLAIEGLGAVPSDVVIAASSAGSPALKYVAPGVGTAPLTLFTLRNLTVASAGDAPANPALLFDGSAQNAVGGAPVFGSASSTAPGLRLENVVLRSGTTTIQACGNVELVDMDVGSDDALLLGPLVLNGNAWVRILDSTLANVTAQYLAPCSVLPQVGVFFQACLLLASAEANLSMFGAPHVDVDVDTIIPVRGTNFTGTSVLGFVDSQLVSVAGVPVGVDPYIAIRGRVGAISLGAPSGSPSFTSSCFINLGATPPFATGAGPTAASGWGFVGDGGTFYCALIVFVPDFGAVAFNPSVHHLTADNAHFFGGILVTGAVGAVTRPVFSTHGAAYESVGRANGIQAREGVDVDLRAASFDPTELTVDGSGAIDRSTVALSGQPNTAASQTVTFNATTGNLVPFPTYVDGSTARRAAVISPGAASGLGDLPVTGLVQTYNPLAFTYALGTPGPGKTIDFVVQRP